MEPVIGGNAMRDPILIVGCARSGTSMTAGMINICGAFGGDMYGPGPWNQKGMFENIDIRANIVKPYLQKIGVDPRGQRPLPNNRQVFEVSPPEVEAWRRKVRQSIRNQGYRDGEWFYKCPKSAMIWFLWHQAFPEAKWVIVRRRHEDIINSCLKTKFLTAYQNKEGWQSWVDAYERRFMEMKTAGLNVREFWPSNMIAGDYDYAREMIQELGLRWEGAMVRAFIDPTLFRG